ncbi:hypothetical protein [Janthinobacterium lividum]|uniref:hypothetical protein n=1 Tax=Janthinobacterium lividum TaxID=29581 RepID=UPI00087350EB|nr:hypothetical protein [Janthinobacterium lividum]MCC7712050.1 hypothetical protein [Janthinobacterium lividum]OEZ57107.1 hypothetical protein JANLI_26780 [Janthinobacterium lividum]WQE27264.1 hypothetical protein U0004_19975 [Janthinobacterium lividum]STQ98159.1 Uncharacterised protein [Janthinobacterium lividum]
MKHLFSLALAVLPLAAAAQSPSAPQEAQASVPATTYRSAFAGYRPAAEDDATSDQAWRALNEKVGKAGGHMGMMKMEGHKMDGHKMEGHKMPMQHAMPKPGPKPDAQPAPQHQHEGH